MIWVLVGDLYNVQHVRAGAEPVVLLRDQENIVLDVDLVAPLVSSDGLGLVLAAVSGPLGRLLDIGIAEELEDLLALVFLVAFGLGVGHDIGQPRGGDPRAA